MFSKSGINLLNLYRCHMKLPVRLGFEHFYVLSNSLTTSKVCQKRIEEFEVEKMRNEFIKEHKKEYEDTFGNIEQFELKFAKVKDDMDDIEQYKREKKALGKTTAQYIKEIKELLRNHNYKKALEVLEVDVVNDKKKNVLFLYEMMISYNGLQGNLKEAYRLYIKYKKIYKPLSPAMFTSLFNACANCRNSLLALEKADAIRNYLLDNKYLKPNITNYNAMLKAYGRHGDINTVLKIFDEVLEKRGKVNIITYSFLLQSCISDPNSGLRHALILWRKMLQNRQKPDVFLFNLILRCVRDCSFGEPILIDDAVKKIIAESNVFYKRKVVYEKDDDGETKRTVYKVLAQPNNLLPDFKEEGEDKSEMKMKNSTVTEVNEMKSDLDESSLQVVTKESNEESNLRENVETEFMEGMPEQNENSLQSHNKMTQEEVTLPNLLSLKPTVGSVIEFGNMTTPQERFMCLGGLEGFLKTMSEFNVRPNIKTFTLLLDVLPPCKESEEKIMDLIREFNIKFDVAFFNAIIARRHFRFEDSIQDALNIMRKERISPDLTTFKVLSFGCATYESGMELIETIRTSGFRPDNDILQSLLKNASYAQDMKYVNGILQAAKANEVQPDAKFIALLSSVVKKEKRRRKESANNDFKETEKLDATEQSAEESLNKISGEIV